MLSAFINIFRVPDLRKKVFFTLLMLGVYRIGKHVPLPGIDQDALMHFSKNAAGGAAGTMADFYAMFTGGDLDQSTIFGLGIMPYISASIILQLLVTVVPALEKIKREGESGMRKINEYTRYATVALCIFQAVWWVNHLLGNGLVYADYTTGLGYFSFAAVAVCGLTAGTMLLMWIGEQIDEYGVGNGISLIIMAGIVCRLPMVLWEVVQGLNIRGAAVGGSLDAHKVMFLAVSFVVVVAGAILITQAQRRIVIQQAKQTRGRRVVGGARHYLPLRVNHGGVMPIIFASSLLLFPGVIFGWFERGRIWPESFWTFLSIQLQPGRYMYEVSYIALVYFFAYFWTSVQFQPKELANNLRDMGSFIPGLRPGKRTADYLESVMNRITYVGAGFLAVIAVIPSVVAVSLEIPFRIATFLGGTGLLIVVSVALDLIQRLEANLVMRNYEGFLSGEGAGRIKGRSY